MFLSSRYFYFDQARWEWCVTASQRWGRWILRLWERSGSCWGGPLLLFVTWLPLSAFRSSFYFEHSSFVFMVSHFAFGEYPRLLFSASFEFPLPPRFGSGESNLKKLTPFHQRCLLFIHIHKQYLNLLFIKSADMLNANTSSSFSLCRRCIN